MNRALNRVIRVIGFIPNVQGFLLIRFKFPGAPAIHDEESICSAWLRFNEDVFNANREVAFVFYYESLDDVDAVFH